MNKKDDRDIVVSLGRSENFAAITRTVKTSWPKFANFLVKDPPVTDNKASVGWYCTVHFEPSYRDSKNYVARHCLTFDYDHIDEWDLDDIKETYKKYAYVMYTTASHTPEKPRVRLVMPLTRPCERDEFCAVTRRVASYFDIEKLARESDVPAQMMFLPSKKADGEFWSTINDGEWIDVDEVLDEYDDWKRKSDWPKRLENDSIGFDDSAQPPDEKRGIVGDFCRAFRVPDAISQFELPYVEGSTADRFTYTEGSRPDGLRLYDDGLKAHSDHDTDPAHGQNNAFDLVRIHKFGKLDTNSNLPIVDQPSYKAMCTFAADLPELQQARAESEFEQLEDLETEEVEDGYKRFQIIRAPEYAAEVTVDWIIKGVMPRAELVVIYGQSGSGKSFLALDLCAAIERGVPWRENRATQGSAVYVCAEGAGGFRQRIRAYSQKHDVSLHNLGIIGDAPNLLDEADTAQLTKAIVDEFKDVDVIVIDTLSATIPGGDENTGKDLGKVVAHCRFLHKKTGALVVLIHHSGKDASKGARGWSGLRAAADAEIEITRAGDYRTASVSKMKDGSDGKQWVFKLESVLVGVDSDGDEITSCVLEHLDMLPQETKAAPRGTYAKNALDTAHDMLRTGGSITVDELVEKCVERLPQGEEGKRDTRKQSTIRAIQKLVVDGYLYKHPHNRVSFTMAAPVDEEWDSND